MKTSLFSVTALIFALTLTACGGDQAPAEDKADDKAASTTTAPATTKEETKPDAAATPQTPAEETKPDTTPAPPTSETSTETKAVAAADSTPLEESKPATTPEPPAPSSAPAPTAANAAPQSTTTAAVDGEKVYNGLCQTCHNAGVAGAPKLTDKAAWAPRLATGVEALYATSISGKGAMPPKGGNPALTDAEIKAAVDYMVSKVK
jgi:cytochrome c5